MIISASYKTDIPAFYGEWFWNRLCAGYCKMVNPYNRDQHTVISLQREDVDGFIFWTKNLSPFVETLNEVHQQTLPFVTQFTINGYPRELESRVVDVERSVETFRLVSSRYGKQSVVWRYDTIVFSTITPADFHRANFSDLAAKLSGYTDEVVFSFMQLYQKTRKNLNETARVNGFAWHDPPLEAKRALLKELVEIASKHEMRLTICTQPELSVPGAGEARCVDAERLTRVADRPFRSRLKGMRQGCGCYESKDIGDYDTCPHGCVYCYAVRDRTVALQRFRGHDPRGEYLFPPKNSESSPPELVESRHQQQMSLIPLEQKSRKAGSDEKPTPKMSRR